MNALEKALHERALEVSRRYRKTESELLEILQKIDEKRVFRALKYSSLFQYAISELNLSESTAYNFITVARKAREIPEIKSGSLSVATVRKLTPVINRENAMTWMDKAKSLSKPALEKEIARIAPQVLTPERSKYVTDQRMILQYGVSEELFQKLSRIKDILSQRLKRSATMEEAMEEMANLYLTKHDPIEKAKRAVEKQATATEEGTVPQPVLGQVERKILRKKVAQGGARRAAIPAAVEHAMVIRDQGQCSFIGPQGEQCNERRWLERHHIRSRADGGGESLDNLQLLCFGHHRVVHQAH